MKIRYPEVVNPGGGEWLDGQVYSIQSDRHFRFKGSLKCCEPSVANQSLPSFLVLSHLTAFALAINQYL